MRTKTTTNSAPPAAVTLSKQRPRPFARITRRTYPIKSSQRTAGCPQTADKYLRRGVKQASTHTHARTRRHTQAGAGALVRATSYSQVSAPSQCLRSPTPNRDRITVQQSVCGSKVASWRPGASVTFSFTGLLLFRFLKETFTRAKRGKNVLQWLPPASLAFCKLLHPSPGNTVY